MARSSVKSVRGSPKASPGGRSEVFRALADDTRRVMLVMLSKRPQTATELGAPFEMSAPAVSQHLGVLREAGLVEVERVGKYRLYKLCGGPLAEVASWLGQLDALAAAHPGRVEKAVARLKKELAGP